MTDPPVRLALTVVYHPTDRDDQALVLRFDSVRLDQFAPSFYSERFDLYVTREGAERGWETTFRVTDEDADWIAFWCSDFTITEESQAIPSPDSA